MNIDHEDYFIEKNINILDKDSYNSSYIYREVSSIDLDLIIFQYHFSIIFIIFIISISII